MFSAVLLVQWHWNSLVRGENLTGKHFNQPPDGPYGSWYGHYKVPLEDPFSVVEHQQQEVHALMSFYLEVMASFSSGNHSKSPEPFESSLGTSNGHVVEMDIRPLKACEVDGNLSPVEEQDFSSEVGFFRKIWCRWFGGKDGASEIKSQNIPEKCSDSGDISEKTSHSYPEKSCINSDNFEKIKVNEKSMRSPSQDAYPVGSSEENKSARSTEPPDDNYTPRTGVLKRIINWCKFQSSSQDTDTSVDPSNKRQIEINSNSHRHEVFMKDSFWSDMESFMDSPRGSVIVTQSRTREQLAQCLRKEGPLALRDLSDSDLLNLVDMLISEKKWVEESPSEISPFKLTRPVVTRSSLGHSCAANGLRSIFLSTQSQSNLPNVPELNGEKKVQNISHAGVSPPTGYEKPLDRSRNDILADCQNLVSEILKEHPEGYNMGSFRKLFLERYGYHLDLKQLGYQKLASLILMMPGVKIESSHIFPSRQKVGGSDQEFFFDKVQEDNAYHPLTSSDSESSETSKKNDDSDSPWDELGPISNSSFDRKDGQSMPRNSVMEEKKKRYPDYEPSVSDDEISDSEDEVSTGTLPEGRGKPVIKEEDSSLLQILNSWYSSNEGDQKKDRLENVDGMVDCSTKGVKPSSSSEISTKGETSSVIFKRKQRPQRSYSFVSDPVENNKDKLIDGILGSLKKSGESRIQS
ncbi:uncharacterized protein LOC116122522 [Pistacia vera]|uniref:uncharacterized protein LOC116122522 n=1 Tax=Pistacia vera TaxID=55513 RepID=UPI001262F3CD|nr:uncharacterized protein LOC116122522 [Pistacia vera]